MSRFTFTGISLSGRRYYHSMNSLESGILCPAMALMKLVLESLHFTKMSGSRRTSLNVCDADTEGEMEFLDVLCTALATALVKMRLESFTSL